MQDLVEFSKKHNIKYFMISFTDLFGAQRAKTSSRRSNIRDAEGWGRICWFATWLHRSSASRYVGCSRCAPVIKLPWKREVAWVAANCVMEGQPVAQAPRNVLLKQINAASEQGAFH